MSKQRTISKLVEPQQVIEGAGVLLRRSIAPSRNNLFDPFLLFDHFAFNDPIEGPLVGFPMHPHRGIETVTYMLEGAVHHRDSLGNSGLVGEGDVQWMTSGSGILHEEMPRRSPQGNVYGFQLWVNLPSALKMSEPRYQEVSADTIPAVEKDGVKVRIVAGEYAGLPGPVTEIAADPIYLDVQMDQGCEFIQPIPFSHTAVVYIFEGQGIFGPDVEGHTQSIKAVHMIEYSAGDYVKVIAPPESRVRFVLIAGAPHREAIVPYGSFVMNTEAEIKQAFEDLRNGNFVKV